MSQRLDDIWDSWSWIIKPHLVLADEKLCTAMSDATNSGVPRKQVIEYFRSKLDDMIQEIAIERDTKKKGPKRRNYGVQCIKCGRLARTAGGTIGEDRCN
ncbi:hypothetical protein [Paenibacillus sp. UMB4589-SE434]|uniref:hypothetical protein n=1 Tax=Paenibacillus sp. UMB4589-SE434 TaxID=3046314 RepID=UPI002550659F|nr:hypothetical protein [Paenibacillus sp. UMB4589-SE434]MDK8182082.1 hypothetical protein [Paenibacillus sp. UMB4589-SE434]